MPFKFGRTMAYCKAIRRLLASALPDYLTEQEILAAVRDELGEAFEEEYEEQDYNYVEAALEMLYHGGFISHRCSEDPRYGDNYCSAERPDGPRSCDFERPLVVCSRNGCLCLVFENGDFVYTPLHHVFEKFALDGHTPANWASREDPS